MHYTQPRPDQQRPCTALFTAALLALLCACTGLPEAGAPASVDRAERLQRAGNAAEAAQMYERLAANNPPPARNDLALSAARAWLAANRADDAQRTLESIVTGLSSSQQLDRDLLMAEVATTRGQHASAWQQLARIPEPARATDAYRLFQLQQQVALRAGQPLEAVRAGIARERVATSDADRSRARRELLNDLRAAIDLGLKVDPATSGDALTRGWLEVGQIAATAGRTPLGAEAAIARWRGRYPGHPAATIVASEILGPASRLESSGPLATSSSSIALLLPVTGGYAPVAALIRDGFLAAVERLPQPRPVVRIYDTGTISVTNALRNAQAEGAGFIVGPLTRDEVQEAIKARPPGLPMMLLNTTDDASIAPPVYQYALSPEDEARQIARQITGAGKRGVAVITPRDDWGKRVTDAISNELQQDGGQLVTLGMYDGEALDLDATITAVLGIGDARRRHERMQQITRMNLQFVAYPRPDIDAIFVAGYDPLALRQINPLRRFYNAQGIPTFVTRSGLDTDAQANRDLGGMYVLDMPWMLDAVGPVADLRSTVQAGWSPSDRRNPRYYAFGFDAAELVLRLRQGGRGAWPMDGLTGHINLTDHGRFELGMNWAQLGEDGQIRPTNPDLH